MKARIGIIGTGWVGTSVAFSTLLAGHARELWLHDTRAAVAEGEAMDLADGAAFYPRCAVRAVALEQMREADVVVRPSLNNVSSADFGARRQSIEAGRAAMEQALPRLRALMQAAPAPGR